MDNKKIFIVLLGLVTFTFTHAAKSADVSEYNKLDSFYAGEFKKFNNVFNGHITQIDKCLKEMDAFEKGDIFKEPIECKNFNAMRPDTASLIEEIQVVTKSYGNWLKQVPQEESSELSLTEYNNSSALIEIYTVKFKKSMIQTKRVRRQEKKIVGNLNQLSDELKRLQTEKDESRTKSPNN